MKDHHKANTRPTANKALQSSLDAANASLLASLTRERPLSQSIELGESAAGKQYVKSVTVAQQAGEEWPDFCDRALDMLAKLRGGIDRAERLAAELQADLEREETADALARTEKIGATKQGGNGNAVHD